jgi:hypothetical protein
MKIFGKTNITGRDNIIIAKALAYAITTIDSLPRVRQEGSDRDDMLDLLSAMVPDEAQRSEIMQGARRHMGFEPFFKEQQDHQRHLN